MAKHKAPEPQPKDKVFTSPDEISQSIAKLRARIHQVEELKKDGLPYRDALRVTAEYQLRDSILEIFGERSPEYLQHQHLRIKVNSKHSINETIALLQHLVVALEERRLELLGLRAVPSNKSGGTRREPAPSTSQSTSPDSPPVKTPVQSPEPKPVPQPLVIPPPTSETVQPGRRAQQPDAPITATAEITPPTAESLVPSAAPPIMLVSQTKLKLSAEAVAHIPETRILSSSPPLRVQAEAAPADVSGPQPRSENSMASKLSFPSAGAQPEPAPPQPPVAPHPPLEDRHDMTTQARAAAEAPTEEETDTDTIGHLRTICSAFHRVARQLRQRRDERPTLEVEDERDVLDLLQALLSIQYDSIEPEEWSPSYANGSTRTDLWLKEEGVVIIAKKTKQGVGVKALTHQVSVDFERYGSHPDCTLMFCFIYDPEGRIGHPKGLEGDLTLNYNGRQVEALISPK